MEGGTEKSKSYTIIQYCQLNEMSSNKHLRAWGEKTTLRNTKNNNGQENKKNVRAID